MIFYVIANIDVYLFQLPIISYRKLHMDKEPLFEEDVKLRFISP